jgi:ribosomal protein L23
MHALELIGKPLITEKAYKQVEKMNTYWFRIDKFANKNDVKQALETIYKVEPLSIRVINVVSKGRQKTIVTLREGDKIELSAV